VREEARNYPMAIVAQVYGFVKEKMKVFERLCQVGKAHFRGELRAEEGITRLTPEGVSYRVGNLWGLAVSNGGRTRAPSHPCERGAGFLSF
jgi:hypothetical protein